MKKLLLLCVLCLLTVTVRADEPPTLFTTAYNAAHWIGSPAIAVYDVGLIQPSSGTMRLGTVTLPIQAYSYGHYAIGAGNGAILDVSFDDGTWRYYGPEGSAEGHITSWQ